MYTNNNISIILTSTVNVQSKSFLFQSDKQDRINTYLKSIKQWLSKTTFNIILVENSGYNWVELKEELDIYKNRFEIISFNEYQLKEAKYLYKNVSKGDSEIFAINYAFNKSQLTKKSIFIIKVTARFFIPEFESYLSNYKLDDYDGITQNDTNRCEMLGSHIKNFNTIFNPTVLYNKDIKNIKDIGHIEFIYRDRCKLFNNILQFKIIDIENT